MSRVLAVTKRVVLVAVATVAILNAHALARAGELDHVFEEGNRAYAEGRFGDAVASYQRLLDHRVRDPAVLMNLGDALYRMDRLAEARLSWERSIRRAPGDRDVEDNLALVVGRLGLEPPAQPSWPERAFDAVLRLAGPDGWIAVALSAWVAFNLALGSGWVTDRGRVVRLAITAVAAVGLSAAVPVAWVFQARLERAEAVALSGSLPVLSAPEAGATSLFTLPLGQKVGVEGGSGDWTHVSLPNGWHGWVAAASIGRIDF